jgi:hypothetical protein
MKRIDAMLALPLARFRRQLTLLTLDELTALEKRIAVQTMRNRWARGGHGLARHRAMNELGLLARRGMATRREREFRSSTAPAPLDHVERSASVLTLPVLDREPRAA